MYEVTYIINATGVKVTKQFDSEYRANQTVNKLKRSKVCTLVSVMKW